MLNIFKLILGVKILLKKKQMTTNLENQQVIIKLITIIKIWISRYLNFLINLSKFIDYNINIKIKLKLG